MLLEELGYLAFAALALLFAHLAHKLLPKMWPTADGE
jgi:hypothetical protein